MRSDEALYEALLEGDLSSFDVLYERHERPLFGFIRRYLPEASDAEDVLHEAFLALLRDRAGARSARSLRAWLFQVARNLCLNHLRSRHRAARALEKEDPYLDPVLQPERALADRQTRESLSVAVAKLPSGLAELYRLRVNGLSYEEMAALLAVPLGTVKSRMHQMVTFLRKELQP